MTLDYKTRQAKSGQATSLVIFLHGYGADGNDLLGLADPLSQHLPDTMFAAPDAPETCRMNPMGFQWFPIPWIDGSTPVESGMSLEKSRDVLAGFLDQIATETGIAAERTILVGFSQGTMMSLDVGPMREKSFAGIIGFSGRLLEAECLDNATSKPPIQLIHGDQDDMVPFSSMAEAETALSAAGFAVKTHTSPGTGHGIAPDGLGLALQRITEWLVD
ncbi:MAG: dienelactone hydrolase family protein [Pseudomonadota bacterium]